MNKITISDGSFASIIKLSRELAEGVRPVLRALDTLDHRSIESIGEMTGLTRERVLFGLIATSTVRPELVGECLAPSPLQPTHRCDGKGPVCANTARTLHKTECTKCDAVVGDCYLVAMLYGSEWSCWCGSRKVYFPVPGVERTYERSSETVH